METGHMKRCLNPTYLKSSQCAQIYLEVSEKSFQSVMWLDCSLQRQNKKGRSTSGGPKYTRKHPPTTRHALHKGAVRGARHWHLRTCQHSITFPPQGGDLVPTCDCPPKKNDSIRPLIKRLKMTSDIHRWCTVGMDRWMNGSTKHQTLTPVTTLHFPFPLPE